MPILWLFLFKTIKINFIIGINKKILNTLLIYTIYGLKEEK